MSKDGEISHDMFLRSRLSLFVSSIQKHVRLTIFIVAGTGHVPHSWLKLKANLKGKLIVIGVLFVALWGH